MFIPRDPVIENIFAKFAAQQDNNTGLGQFLAKAGAVVYHLTKSMDATNGSDTELVVRPLASGVANSVPAVGFLEQAVKTDYHDVHPAGYVFQRDMAGSWAVAMPEYGTNPATGATEIIGTKAVAVAVANLGIWETSHYTSFTGGDVYDANNYTPVVPMQPMYVDDTRADGAITNRTTSLNNGNPVAVAFSGNSADKVMKNATNQGTFPIKVKLLI